MKRRPLLAAAAILSPAALFVAVASSSCSSTKNSPAASCPTIEFPGCTTIEVCSECSQKLYFSWDGGYVVCEDGLWGVTGTDPSALPGYSALDTGSHHCQLADTGTDSLLEAHFDEGELDAEGGGSTEDAATEDADSGPDSSTDAPMTDGPSMDAKAGKDASHAEGGKEAGGADAGNEASGAEAGDATTEGG
jgi:hypothetical protein